MIYNKTYFEKNIFWSIGAAAIMDFGPKPLFPVRGKLGNFLWIFRTSCRSIITKNSIVKSHVQVLCNTYWTKKSQFLPFSIPKFTLKIWVFPFSLKIIPPFWFSPAKFFSGPLIFFICSNLGSSPHLLKEGELHYGMPNII